MCPVTPGQQSDFRHEGGGRVSEGWNGQGRSKSPRTCRDVRLVSQDKLREDAVAWLGLKTLHTFH